LWEPAAIFSAVLYGRFASGGEADFANKQRQLDGLAAKDRSPSVDAPLQARENVGVVVARGRMLSSVRPLMRQEHSRRPVWEFADWVQITRSVLEAQW